jgi:hypothetical protein
MNQAPRHGLSSRAEHDAILDQVEAHALGALDRTDAGIVEQHLRWCAPCRDQAESIRRVVDLLPLALPVDEAPSADVKRALFGRVAVDDRELPYEPPLDRRPDTEARQRLDNARPERERAAIGSRTPGPWSRIVAPALIAPLALALIVVGAWANSMRLDLADQQDSTLANGSGLNRLAASGDAVQFYSMEPQCDDCPGRGRLGVNPSDNMGVVVAWGLNPDEDHEVWCVDTEGDKAMVSTLDVNTEGGAMQAFAFPSEDVSQFKEVYVTQKDGEAMYMVHLEPGAGTPAASR